MCQRVNEFLCEYVKLNIQEFGAVEQCGLDAEKKRILFANFKQAVTNVANNKR